MEGFNQDLNCHFTSISTVRTQYDEIETEKEIASIQRVFVKTLKKSTKASIL